MKGWILQPSLDSNNYPALSDQKFDTRVQIVGFVFGSITRVSNVHVNFTAARAKDNDESLRTIVPPSCNRIKH